MRPSGKLSSDAQMKALQVIMNLSQWSTAAARKRSAAFLLRVGLPRVAFPGKVDIILAEWIGEQRKQDWQLVYEGLAWFVMRHKEWDVFDVSQWLRHDPKARKLWS